MKQSITFSRTLLTLRHVLTCILLVLAFAVLIGTDFLAADASFAAARTTRSSRAARRIRPVKIKTLKYSYGKVVITWKTNKYAKGYRIYRRKKGSKKWKRIRTIKGAKKNTYRDRKVSFGTKYKYCVTSYGAGVESRKYRRAKTVSTIHKHKYKVVSLKKPDCTHDGLRISRCIRCNKKKSTTISKLGHASVISKDGYYTVETCERCGEKLDSYLQKNIPSYWNREIVSALKASDAREGIPGYVYFTDSHWNANAKRSPAIVQFATKKLGYPFAVYGGDVVTGYHKTAKEAKAEIKEFYSKFKINLFSTTGNHDFNSNENPNTKTYLTHDDVFSLMYAKEASFANLEGRDRFSFTDDTVNKIRYISFYYDELEPVPDDVIAMIQTRTGELDQDWIVVLFSHAYWHFKKAGTESKPSAYGKTLANQLLDIQKNSAANIALWHVGHIHRDHSGTITNSAGDSSILVVSTSSDAYSKSVKWGGPEMKKGTKTEQIVEIVQIDRINRKVYMTRIGAGTDRQFEYSEKEVPYTEE